MKCPTCGQNVVNQKEHCSKHDMTFNPGSHCPSCYAESHPPEVAPLSRGEKLLQEMRATFLRK